MAMNWHEIKAEMDQITAKVQPLEVRYRELKQMRGMLEKEAVAKGLKPHGCCNIEGNLVLVEKGERVTGTFKGQAVGGDKIIKQCKQCGARHHEVALDPIEIKLEGKAASGG